MNRIVFSTNMNPKMPQDGINGFTSDAESATIIASPKMLRPMMLNHIVRVWFRVGTRESAHCAAILRLPGCGTVGDDGCHSGVAVTCSGDLADSPAACIPAGDHERDRDCGYEHGQR